MCTADLGASKAYIKPQDKAISQNCQKIINGPQVLVPNGINMRTLESGYLPLHKLLSTHAKKANILEGLSNALLLSIGQLCDNYCIDFFDKRAHQIFKKGILILRSRRNWIDGLWDVDIKSTPPQESLNYII